MGSSDKLPPKQNNIDQNQIDKQYQDILRRSEILKAQYRKITGKEPPLESELLPPNTENKIKPDTSGNQNINLLESSSESSSEHSLDIVIGMAQDTDPKNLVTFCSSLREHSSVTKSKVVLFINTPIQDRSREIAKKYDIDLIEFDIKNLSLTPSNIFLESYHPSSLRWGLILKYFKNEETRKKYFKVLLVDVRDTFFQSDPFELISEGVSSVFYGFKGVESITISECGWNGGWIRDCFGDNLLGNVGGNNIICSGVSIGTMDSVYEYLVNMDDILMNRKTTELSMKSNFPRCERNGVDQGVRTNFISLNILFSLKFGLNFGHYYAPYSFLTLL